MPSTGRRSRVTYFWYSNGTYPWPSPIYYAFYPTSHECYENHIGRSVSGKIWWRMYPVSSCVCSWRQVLQQKWIQLRSSIGEKAMCLDPRNTINRDLLPRAFIKNNRISESLTFTGPFIIQDISLSLFDSPSKSRWKHHDQENRLLAPHCEWHGQRRPSARSWDHRQASRVGY